MVSTVVENKNYTPEELAGLRRFLEVYGKLSESKRRIVEVAIDSFTAGFVASEGATNEKAESLGK